MTTQPRRWFRFAFSLRTLFIIVTLLACALGWLAWQIQIVQERKAVLQELGRTCPDQAFYDGLESTMQALDSTKQRQYVLRMEYIRVPYFRRLLGDRPVVEMVLPNTIDLRLIERMELALPETYFSIIETTSDASGEAWHAIASRESLDIPHALREPKKGNVFKTGLIEK